MNVNVHGQQRGGGRGCENWGGGTYFNLCDFVHERLELPVQLVNPCRGICECLARRGDVRFDLLCIVETGNCQRWKVYGNKEIAQTKLEGRRAHFFLPSFHAHRLLLERRLLLLYARLKRRGETVSPARVVRETMGNLELFRLALLVILELVHVLLKLFDFCLGRYLFLPRGFQGDFHLGDALLKLRYLCADLQSSTGEPR